MNTVVSSLSREVLEDLYIKQQLSLSVIAKRYGSSPKSVALALRARGLAVRPPGLNAKHASRRNGQPLHQILTREKLIQMYVEEGLLCRQIAARYGCHAGTIDKLLRRHGIPALVRRSGNPGPRSALDLTKETLEKLYVEMGVSIKDIGERFGCTPTTIRRRLKAWGLWRCRSSNPVPFVGMRHGLLTVICQAPTPPNRRGSYWLCGCQCGKEKVVKQTRLFDPTHKGCGCQRHRKGSASVHWKGGTRNAGGYVIERIDGPQRRVLQHRLVMERTLGRPLLRSENVHHINGVRHDNRPENLELWVKAHPCGQRVPDVVAHAVEMLKRYAPDRLVTEYLG